MPPRRALLGVTSTLGIATSVGCLGAVADDDSEQDDDSERNDEPGESGPIELDPDSHPSYANWVQAGRFTEQFFHIEFDQVESSSVLRREPMEESDGQYSYPHFDTLATTIPAETSFGPFFALGVATQTFSFLDRLAFGTASADDPVGSVATLTHSRDSFRCAGEIDVEPVEHMTGLLDSYHASEPTIDADLGWLLEHCDSGALVHGGPIEDGVDEEIVDIAFNVSDDELDSLWSLYDEATQHVAVLDVDDDTGHVTRTGAVYDNADGVPEEDEIVSVLGADATDTRVVTDGPRFMIEATWDM